MNSTQNIITQTEAEKSINLGKLDNDESLKKSLIDIAYMLGIKEPPIPELLNQMIDTLKDQFSDLSINTINKAVKLALGGKLDINFQPYNNFTIPYICNILISYRNYKSHQPVEYNEYEKPRITEEERIDIRRDWLQKCVYLPIERFMRTGIYEVRDLNSMIYNFLKNGGLINFTQEKENRILEEAKQDFFNKNKSQYEAENINVLITKLQDGGKDVDGLIELRKNNRALKAFLIDCRETNRDILHEIKQIDEMTENQRIVT